MALNLLDFNEKLGSSGNWHFCSGNKDCDFATVSSAKISSEDKTLSPFLSFSVPLSKMLDAKIQLLKFLIPMVRISRSWLFTLQIKTWILLLAFLNADNFMKWKRWLSCKNDKKIHIILCKSCEMQLPLWDFVNFDNKNT